MRKKSALLLYHEISIPYLFAAHQHHLVRNKTSPPIPSDHDSATFSLQHAWRKGSGEKMPAAYEIRAGGDVKNKKQSMADLKLRRLNELNSRLREDLERPRIKVSEASMS